MLTSVIIHEVNVHDMLKHKLTKRKILAIAIVLAFGFFAVFELTGRTSVFLDHSKKVVDTKSKTTSDEPSAQADYSDGGNREPAGAQSKDTTAVQDTRGIDVPESAAQPLVSTDGAITVYSPGHGAVLLSGSSLTGKATVSVISYRLIDNKSGVTATGDLKVVNGNFSGKFNYSNAGTEGRLDVFQTGPGGIEKSILEIPVKLR